MSDWRPNSWRAYPAKHQPTYDEPAALEATLERIRMYPPLVAYGEIVTLRKYLAEAAEGRRFVLQGGDCSESFRDCSATPVMRKLKILLQMSLLLSYASRKRVLCLGRMAGQYAKPRSSDTEVISGKLMTTFRGDNVNSSEADVEARRPDPQRLERGYFMASSTLNFARALLQGGFARLQSPADWQLDWVRSAERRDEYERIAHNIRDALTYLDSIGAASSNAQTMDFFTSHEGLLLPYEEAMTRTPRAEKPIGNLGAHFLWIGDRTRGLDGAHVEYFRGIINPVGVKIGPTCSSDELLELLDVLDPNHEPGRVTLITRYGVSAIHDILPRHIRAVANSPHKVVWSCDPMHANTVKAANGLKTRNFATIMEELELAFTIHRESGSNLNGVHFELTGDQVTECTGGSEGLSEADLPQRYDTGCDPRLNYTQSLEIAMLLGRLLEKGNDTNVPPARLKSAKKARARHVT
jgi:3-deoxy-7-phosphoheptulonate synthase